MSRRYEIVLIGATGFTGLLTAKHLHANGPLDLRWAIAGRSRSKLEKVVEDLKKINSRRRIPDIIVADSRNKDSLRTFVGDTDVVLSTVGPFALYGQPLSDLCAELGTHYCDSTGEATYITQDILRNNRRAQQNGVALVHCCGLDSIPSDLGVYLLADYVKNQMSPSEGLGATRMVLTDIKELTPSGGTLASMLTMFEVSTWSDLAQMNNPFTFVKDSSKKLPAIPSRGLSVKYDNDLKMTIGPFIMESINAKNVGFSSTFLNYGPKFSYREYETSSLPLIAK